MKRFFLLSSLMIATVLGVSAQENPTRSLPPISAAVAEDALQAGNWMLGGGLGSIGHNFSTGTFQLNLVPHAGFFIYDNFVLGAQVNLGLTAYEEGTNFNFGLAPFLRYYVGQRMSGRWFGELGAGLAGSSLVGSESDNAFSGLLNLRVGYAHFVTNNVALEASTGYNFTGADLQSVSTFSGLGVVFGFQIYLPGRRNRDL